MENKTQRRLQNLFSHIQNIPSSSLHHNSTSFETITIFDVPLLSSLASRILREKEVSSEKYGMKEYREKTWRVLSNADIYKIDYNWDTDTYRAELHKQFHHFIKHGLISVEFVSDLKNIFKFFGIMEAAILYDVSFAAKVVVHFQLYGTCITKLGSDRHLKYLKNANNGLDIGSFAMTEIGHGSNVRAIGTTAIYDEKTKEFIINTPNDSSIKMWMGNTAVYGTKTIVFAQLITKNRNHGVHAFLVPIRYEHTLQILPNIVIRDLGRKNGWNGVDNSAIIFNHVRIPRENLLNKFGDVLEDGTYISPIKNEGKRFGATLFALMFGRLLYIVGPCKVLEMALTIAIRYAHQRRQFGEKGKENLIWTYPTHQFKIFPFLGMVHAFYFTWNLLAHQFMNLNSESTEIFHVIVSGVKAFVCEYVPMALGVLRPMCGGHGYSSFNRIGQYQQEMDVFQTAEGDSTVLYQQTAKYLIDKYRKYSKNPNLETAKQFLINVLNIQSEDSESNPFNFYSQTFLFRTSYLLHFTFSKLMNTFMKTKNFNEAWNMTLVEIVDLSKSFIQNIFLQNFINAIHSTKDVEVKNIFEKLLDIYALNSIKGDLVLFLVNDILKKETVNWIDSKIGNVYSSVNPHVLDIIDSFNIPDFILRAPIGLSNLDYIKNTLNSINMPSLEK